MATSPRSSARTRPHTGPPSHDDLGRRLRARREELKLSLREFARRLDISPSAISQIETGKARPSVSTLYEIVSELGITLDELFSDDGDGEAGSRRERKTRSTRSRTSRLEERHVQREETREAIELDTGVRWERLTAHADPDADFLYVVYDVGGSSSKGNSSIRHSGREYGLVLSGRLEVTVGFDTYELGPGDSISFDSTVPHRLRTIGSEPAHGVWFVIGRQNDERALAFEDIDRGST